MLGELPESAQNRVVEHLREFLEDIRDEVRWDTTFAETQDKLAVAARRAKQEIAAGLAEPLNIDRL